MSARIPFRVEAGAPLAIHYEVDGRRFVTYVGLQALYLNATGRMNLDGTPEVSFRLQQMTTTEEVVPSTTLEG